MTTFLRSVQCELLFLFVYAPATCISQRALSFLAPVKIQASRFASDLIITKREADVGILTIAYSCSTHGEARMRELFIRESDISSELRSVLSAKKGWKKNHGSLWLQSAQ